jgi:hypothetical protein
VSVVQSSSGRSPDLEPDRVPDRRSVSPDGGDTMLELLVAAAVIAVTLMAIFGAMATSLVGSV